MDAGTGAVKVLYSLEKPNQIQGIRSLVWEDDTHVLALFWSNATQTWYPVRFGLDKSVNEPATVPLHNGTGEGLTPAMDRPAFELRGLV